MLPIMTLEEFYALITKHRLLNDIKLQKAIRLAIKSFKGLKRDDGSDVLSQHLLPMTASLIKYYVFERSKIDVEVLIVSLLHDVLEDVKGFDLSMIKDNFSNRVNNMVHLMTKYKQKNRKGYSIYINRLKYNRDYYNQIKSSPREVQLIKAADRLNNLRCAYSNPDRNKISNYIRETEEIYLEMFSKFPYFYKRISKELVRLRYYLNGNELNDTKRIKS